MEEGSDEVGVSKRMVAKGLRFQKKSGSQGSCNFRNAVLYYIVLLIIVMIRKRLAVRRIPVVIPYEN